MSHANLNILPQLLATLLAEQGECAALNIAIHPAEGLPAMTLREVQDVKHNRIDGDLTLKVRSKSDQKTVLEETLSADHALLQLAGVFEREMTFFQIGAMLRERTHLLGLSPLQPVFFPETMGWDDEHKKILTFFLPYGAQISGDLVLMEKCLHAALGEAVRVEKTGPLPVNVDHPRIGNCVLNSGIRSSGRAFSTAPAIKITVSLITPEHLPDYVQDGRQRRFLEAGLLPLFLPQGWEVDIRITVSPEFETFRIAEPERPLCAGFNTIVQ